MSTQVVLNNPRRYKSTFAMKAVNKPRSLQFLQSLPHRPSSYSQLLGQAFFRRKLIVRGPSPLTDLSGDPINNLGINRSSVLTIDQLLCSLSRRSLTRSPPLAAKIAAALSHPVAGGRFSFAPPGLPPCRLPALGR